MQWFLTEFLPLMENPWVVGTLIALTIVARLLWVRVVPRPSVPPTPQRKGKGQPTDAPPPKPRGDFGLEVIDTLLIALILVFGIVRPLLLQTFFIPSESMVPTLLVGDQLIANKVIYRTRLPLPGEVVVFQPPLEAVVGSNDPSRHSPELMLRTWLQEHPDTLTLPEAQALLESLTPAPVPPAIDTAAKATEYLLTLLPSYPTRVDDYIKRVIAVPGDRVRVVANDGVYINGTRVAEAYLPAGNPPASGNFPPQPFTLEPPPRLIQGSSVMARQKFAGDFRVWTMRWYTATKIHAARITPNVRDGEFVVPADSIFVMGDNRDNSFDSRGWGVVPRSRIRARAVSTFWPPWRLKLL